FLSNFSQKWLSRTYMQQIKWLITLNKKKKRSSIWIVVWGFFKTVDSQTVKCLLCSENLSKRVQGTTTAMLRHLRVKHPKEVTKACKGRQPKTGPTNGHQDVNSDIQTTPMESDINSAINEILKSAEGDQEKQAKNGEASDSHPVRRNRHKRSLIWKHYERLESLNAARCSICMKKLQCFEGGSTSNLRRHMSKRHPEVFSRLVADGLKPPPYDLSQCSKVTSDSLTTAETTGPKELNMASLVLLMLVLKGSRPPEGERRVFRRERELIEALRRTQKEEARALEHQRELLEKLRAADAREETAEREKIELLRKLQQEEAKELNGLKESLQKEREELEQEKLELQKKWEELQQEREDLLLYSRGELTS
uniref:BED-type domain-containing protein n=1 Tax=Echeneis naucrates TaxID=173247 RepID=A0A665TH97_ECHNA